MVTLDSALLARYPRFSLYNSPYAAHDHGCAIDLYPETNVAPSPVAGEVLDTRAVRAPPKPYSPEHDYLILVDAGDYVARMLHVEPAVEAGDHVEVGDPLGEMVRAGFFAPWVANHIHLGFRDSDANPYRASGSVPIDLDFDVRPLPWDGTGTVVETGETWIRLDAPAHPAPGEYFAGIEGAPGVVLDGGLPHYNGGGALGNEDGSEQVVSVAGERVGVATGRDVSWDAVSLRANGVALTGLSLFCSQDEFGAKLVVRGHDFAVGDRVELAISRS
ncbi:MULTISPECIES: hypothetical protein [unclassified Haladaptatus]|uniref:hypothetical protein n=1 Tax=unclassified Haladaptatus TaxID=2622732 RepID=UPI0023E7EB23|nr:MULTISPECIES: hypothetical protein [unclassified Haladaptatus]